jgi:hypothetical protein
MNKHNEHMDKKAATRNPLKKFYHSRRAKKHQGIALAHAKNYATHAGNVAYHEQRYKDITGKHPLGEIHGDNAAEVREEEEPRK